MRMSWRFESCSRRQWRFSQEWRINTKYKIQRMLWEIISRLRLFYVEETCDLHQHKTRKWRIQTTKRSNFDVSSSIIVKECSRTMSKKNNWSTINDDFFKTNIFRISFLIRINREISRWIKTRIVTIACQD
jgi:predicted transcriptional regulator